MDTPNKPQTSDEEGVPAPPVPTPSPALPARSPFRPLSRRRRQAQLPEPPAAGAPSEESAPAWRPGHDSDDDDNVVEIELEDGEDGTASSR